MLLIRRARHRLRPIRRRTAGAAALVTLAALAVTLPQAGTAAASDPCRQPVVRDVMVSQGLPTYGQLVRGKTAMVKFFLSEPSSTSCSNVTGESTVITGGRLLVTAAGATTSKTVVLDVTPSGALTEFAEYEVAPVTATPADPRFVVPGELLVSTNPLHATSTFDMSFKAELDYVVRNKSGVVTTGTLPVAQRPNGSAITSVVSKPVKPLRLLVVPMGNSDVTSPEQFPAAAAQDVTAGLAAISRMLPIPDGLGAPDSSAGLRWHLSAGMVDLGPHAEPTADGGTKTVDYMPGGKYCGSGGSFDYIKTQLAQFRSAWNAENAAAPVDRVLGVVWRDVSRGRQTGDGDCIEGYAGVGGTIGWSRVLPAVTGSRGSVTGSISMLELTHTFGGSVVDVTNRVAGASYPHSPFSAADASARNRAYNVPQRAFLDATKNRSVMKYDLAPYDDYGTLLEPKDWDFVLCFLTTTSLNPSGDCGSPANAGASVSAAGGSYVLAGTTDGTPAGTDAHTYFEDDMPRDGTDLASAYRLVQRTATGATTGPSTGVRMVGTASDHPDGGSHVHDSDRLAFDVAIPQQTGAVAFELWKGEPGAAASVQLYRRALDAQAPAFVETSTVPAPTTAVAYTADGTSSQPAVSPNGSLVAFTTPGGVVVARGASDAARSAAVPGSQAAWHPGGNELAVVHQGEVFLVPVTAPAQGAPVLGTPRKVYGSRLGTGTPAASHPSYAPDASELALSIAGDLFAVNLRLLTPDAYPVLCPLDALVQDQTTMSSGLACRRLTSSGAAETAPSWSVKHGLVAYERAGAIWTLDPAVPTTTATSRLGSAAAPLTSPAWAGDRVLATRGGGLISVDATSFGSLVELTTGAGDTWGAASGDGLRIVFERPAGTARDLFSLTVSQQTATATVSDDQPARLRMDLYVVCSGRADPLVVGARPVAVDEASGSAQFDLRFDSSRTCPGGSLLYRTTDGYQVTRRAGEAVAGGGAPVGAVYVPAPGAELLQFDTIAVSGAAKGASGDATSQLAWTLGGPGGFSKALGTGTTVPDVVPPAGGWTPGTWTLTAVPDGDQAAAVTRVFRIVADRDGDGIADSRDSKALHDCYPLEAELKPENALADYDRDLLPSIVDPQPCQSAMNGSVVFNPETLNLVSSGNPITLTLTTAALDVRRLALRDVTISQVGGYDAALAPYALSAKSASVLEAKFDRQAFIDFFNARALRGYVPVVLSARHGGVTARGYDTKAPLYQP